MRIIEDVKLDFRDVLILPKRSKLESRSQVKLVKEYKFMNDPVGLPYKGVPIIASNMDGVGTIEIARTLSKDLLSTCLVKHYDLETLIEFFSYDLFDTAMYSMGITDQDLEKYKEFRKRAMARYVCIDVANGYTERFVEFIKRFKGENEDVIVTAGNVVTPEMTEALLLAGASIVKVGIGSGNACSTRVKTGVGYPQLSAIIECGDAAHGLGGHIIADGGITCGGDIAKAFGAGADFVMLGTFLAGHEEGGGTVIEEYSETPVLENFGGTIKNGVVTTYANRKLRHDKYVEFYGMSSRTAQEKHGDSLKDYRASEGRVLKVPFKGSISDTVQDILGGLRSACTYVGANCLKDLPKRTTFVRVNQQISTLYGVGDLNR